MRTIVALAAAIALLCPASAAVAGTSMQWTGMLDPEGWYHCGFGVGPGAQSGYDGQSPFDVTANAGVYIEHYRVSGSDWSGPTGFYDDDREPPLSAGDSHTWSDIRLWAHDTTLALGDRVGAWYTWGTIPPSGYTGVLTIDYVPVSLNWTGPYQFVIDLTRSTGFYLPCPITDDPFNPDNVTRMHLTVYTYPVPEPSSLAALVSGLAAVGVMVRRRVIR